MPDPILQRAESTCLVGCLMTHAELSAGSLDVLAFALAEDGSDVFIPEDFFKRENGFRRGGGIGRLVLPGNLRRVVGNKIELGALRPQRLMDEPGQFAGVFRRIVYATQQQVFKRGF